MIRHVKVLYVCCLKEVDGAALGCWRLQLGVACADVSLPDPSGSPSLLLGVLQTVGIAAFSDLDDVPYYLCAVMCGMYHVLGQPLESSFHQQLKTARAIGGGGAAAGPPKEAVVQVGIYLHAAAGASVGLVHV
jgi:hypothetical protein